MRVWAHNTIVKVSYVLTAEMVSSALSLVLSGKVMWVPWMRPMWTRAGKTVTELAPPSYTRKKPLNELAAVWRVKLGPCDDSVVVCVVKVRAAAEDPLVIV